MFYQLTQYLKFLLNSTNQHGVHSPFVYNLVTKCFYDSSSYEAYYNIEEYKKKLLNNHAKINVNDLGKGSQAMKSTTRSISNMAKYAGTTIFRAKLLFRLVSYFQSKHILELGTSLGIATQAMCLGNTEANITTIEGCPNLSEFSKVNFGNHQLKNITLLNQDFRSAIKTLSSNTFDLIFFDGNHQKDATLYYFEKLLPTVHNDSVFIFDDIYWSKDMTEAWNTIKKHPKVSVTIDTFIWGFVFFRKEQLKENFKIRV